MDDLQEIILRNILLTNNISIVLCFLDTINKFGIFFNQNRQEMQDNLKQLCDMHWNSDKYYHIFKNNSNYMIYRWAKRILEMLESEIGFCLQQLDSKNQLNSIERLLWVKNKNT